jgi:hypothetical protein
MDSLIVALGALPNFALTVLLVFAIGYALKYLSEVIKALARIIGSGVRSGGSAGRRNSSPKRGP